MQPPRLQFRRFEFKYHLPIFTVDKIIDDLLEYMDWDPFVSNRIDKSYQVNSLYFDSFSFGCYNEKLAGVKERKKLRLRTYATALEPTTKVFLEIKRKDDMVVFKDRLIIDYQDCHNLSDLKRYQFSKQEKKVLEEFLWTKSYNCMTPKLMVVYKRKALVGRFDKRFRITFDSQIQAYPANQLSFSGNQPAAEIFPKRVIMELKYNNGIPYWFHWMIQKYQLSREPFSKYCQSLETYQQNYKHVRQRV